LARFDETHSRPRKQQLINNVCDALTVHTIIEAEIFYPAFI
jgi:hypothetical protein